jgi:uncharacterized Zn-finger protein
MFGFSRNSVIITTLHAYHKILNKGNDPLQMQVPNCFGHPLIFVDVGENLVLADDCCYPLESSSCTIRIGRT